MINEAEDTMKTRAFRVAQAKQLRAYKMALRVKLFRLYFKALYLKLPGSIIYRVRKIIVNLRLLNLKVMLLLTELPLQGYYLAHKVAVHWKSVVVRRRQKMKD